MNPSGSLMAWILLVTFAGLAGPVWAATRIAMNAEDDLVSQRFVACVALNVVFSLVPPFDIQRGKRKVTYSFGEVATLISIAIASAPVAIVAGFVALTIRSVQEYVGRPQERYRILFNYGLGSLGAWVTILVASSFQTAPWNYLVATFIGAIVVDCCLAQCFRIAFELPYRTYFARDWWSRLGIPAAVALGHRDDPDDPPCGRSADRIPDCGHRVLVRHPRRCCGCGPNARTGSPWTCTTRPCPVLPWRETSPGTPCSMPGSCSR